MNWCIIVFLLPLVALGQSIEGLRLQDSGTAKGQIQYDLLEDVLSIISSEVGSQMSFSTDNVERMRIDAAGNVGIGTSSPSYKLENTGSLGLTTQGSVLDFTDGSVLNSRFGVAPIEGGLMSGTTQGDLVIQNHLNNKILFGTNGDSVKMTIAANGNVGVGTTSPIQKLQVEGVLQTGISTASVNAGALSGLPTIYGWNGTTNDAHLPLSIRSTSGTQLYLNTDGNVGIGTTSPSRALHVMGHIQVENVSSQQAIIRFDGSGATTSWFGTSVNGGLVSGIADGDTVMRAQGGNSAHIATDAGPVITSTSVGNVGIGTTAPTHILHITGQGRSTNSSWATSSDRRLKDVLGKYDYGLDEILQMNTYWFRYKKDNPAQLPSDREFSGVMAQELEEIIPEAVEEDESGYLTVNNDPIHWAVINAIKQLWEHWSKSNQDIEKSKIENERLSEKVQFLEEQNKALVESHKKLVEEVKQLKSSLGQ